MKRSELKKIIREELQSLNENVASTILKQLGGNKFLAMTGARKLVGGENSLSFLIPKVKGGINFVKITLNNKDLYDIDFGNFRGASYVVKKTVDDVFAEDLRYVFTRKTGLYTSL